MGCMPLGRSEMYLKVLAVLILVAAITGPVLADEPIIVGNKTCPVSGERLEEGSSVTYEYKGKVYNFCCQRCVEEFKKDPERYIKEMEKSMDNEGPSGHEEHHHNHGHHHHNHGH